MELPIVGGLVNELTTSLVGFANNEIVKVLGVSDEIEKLAENLRSIKREISDDAGRIIAYSEATSYQFKKLTDIAYEAENVIDRFKIKMSMLRTSQLQVTDPRMQSQTSAMKQMFQKLQVCKSCREVDTRYRTAKQVEKLNKRLEGMHVPREVITSGLPGSMNGPFHEEHYNSSGSVMSNDCDDHIRRLQERGGTRALFAIVGPPGVGKTTLARKIYHETRNKFATRLWVHVSSGTGNLKMWSGEGVNSEATQQETIRQRLTQSHNLLLVIDNALDKDGWEFLARQEEGLHNRGVRVIVTTPNWGAARDMSSCCHRVRALSEDDGWQLLKRTAQLNERDIGDIQHVGKSIVRKCSGIPLALEAVGSSLRLKNQVGDWEAELSQDFIVKYDEIRRSIDASYMKLEYRLKRCFLYCSLYPEGFVIQRQHIVQLWTAEGFFESQEGRQPADQEYDPEEHARDCYAELVSRSLLLPVAGADACATLPTLLRSYAIYRFHNEIYGGNPSRIGPGFKVWRLHAADADTVCGIPDYITTLRTLFVFGRSSSNDPRVDNGISPTPPSVMDVICQNFTSLRVLDLRDTRVEAVSRNLGKLLQLRYLNLSNTRIRKLPGEVKNLVMLQFLILKDCPCLTSLPKGVGRLNNLKGLDISGTPQLQSVQFGLHNLKELNCFGGFLPVSSGSASASTELPAGWTFMELSNQTKLTSLQILKLDRSTSSQEAARLRLHEKIRLKELELCCTPVGHGQPSGADAESMGHVLRALKPPRKLTSLRLANFYDSELPNWVSSSYLTNLQRLTLDGCDQCRRLPPLGEMRLLNFLAITGANGLSEIGSELRGRGGQSTDSTHVAFPKLEELVLSEMKNLQAWSDLEVWDMPLLRSLQLSKCPRLGELPTWLPHCTALASLKIQRAEEITEIGELPAVKELQVGVCRALRKIYNLGRLEELDVASCSGLRSVQGVPLLRSVRLHEHAVDLPQWLLEQQRRPYALRTLEIVAGEELLDKCSSELAQYWPVIQVAASHVYAKLHDGSFYFSYTRTSRDTCHNLYRSPRCISRAASVHSSNREAWRMWQPALYKLFFTAILFCFAALFSNLTELMTTKGKGDFK